MARNSNQDSPLNAHVKDGQLQIVIGIGTLVFCASPKNGGPVAGTDTHTCRVDARRMKQWAEDVVHQMTEEADNGDTPLGLFLDRMMIEAVNNGSGALIWKRKKEGLIHGREF